MKDYWFISDTDGHLYDTRKEGWLYAPIRKDYRRTFPEINNVNQLKATLRSGEFTWPGFYPMYFIKSDGAALHFNCVRRNFRSVVDSVKNKADDGWRVIACEINYEDKDLV